MGARVGECALWGVHRRRGWRVEARSGRRPLSLWAAVLMRELAGGWGRPMVEKIDLCTQISQSAPPSEDGGDFGDGCVPANSRSSQSAPPSEDGGDALPTWTAPTCSRLNPRLYPKTEATLDESTEVAKALSQSAPPSEDRGDSPGRQAALPAHPRRPFREPRRPRGPGAQLMLPTTHQTPALSATTPHPRTSPRASRRRPPRDLPLTLPIEMSKSTVPQKMSGPSRSRVGRTPWCSLRPEGTSPR